MAEISIDHTFDSNRTRQADPREGGGYGVPDQTQQSLMGAGHAGLATVIPRARGNVPLGANPHDMSGLSLVIDPHISGQSTVVPLAAITKLSAAAGAEEAEKRAVAMGAHNTMTEPVDLRRLTGSLAMRSIAEKFNETGRTRQVESIQPNQVPGANDMSQPVPQYPPQAAQPPMPAAPTLAAVTPLQAFGQAPPPTAGHPAPPMAVVDTTPPLPVPAHALKKAIIDIPNMGEIAAYYTDVVAHEATLVLIVSQQEDGAMKYVPPATMEGQFAVAVPADGVAYLVEATGIKYPHNGHEHHVLSIVNTAAYAE